MKIDYDLETSPLEIRTDSALGSGEELKVFFFTAGGSTAGGVRVKFSSTPQYAIGWGNPWTNFPATLPTATVKVWRITVDKTSGTRVVIHCNDQEVVNTLFSSSACSSSDWSSRWSKKIEKIEFHSSWDTASDYFRARKLLKII